MTIIRHRADTFKGTFYLYVLFIALIDAVSRFFIFKRSESLVAMVGDADKSVRAVVPLVIVLHPDAWPDRLVRPLGHELDDASQSHRAVSLHCQ